jgi:hypothetical protein
MTPKSVLASLQLVLSISEQNVNNRLKRKTDSLDMVSYILSQNKSSPETGISEAEMIANTMAVIVGGSETLTAALAGRIKNLITHPKEMKALVNEIRSAFNTVGIPCYTIFRSKTNFCSPKRFIPERWLWQYGSLPLLRRQPRSVPSVRHGPSRVSWAATMLGQVAGYFG